MKPKPILCVPGGKPIGRSLLQEILGLRYDGVRVDVPDRHVGAHAVLDELARTPEAYPVFLIAGGEMLRSTGKPFSPDELVAHTNDTCIKVRDFGFFDRIEPPAIEIGNEPNLAHRVWSKYPKLMAKTFNRCYEVVRSYSANCSVLTPSVSNLTWGGFRYLKKMLDQRLPMDVQLAVHRYPHKGDIHTPHPGFKSREQQASKLVGMAAGRDIWITETGMSEGPHERGCLITEEFFRSEDYVADALENELYFWSSIPGVKTLCWYGINDGPNRKNKEHNFGIRRLNGTWKPVAQRVAKVRAAMEAA